MNLKKFLKLLNSGKNAILVNNYLVGNVVNL